MLPKQVMLVSIEYNVETTMTSKEEEIHIRVTKDEKEKLDAYAKESGSSKSEVLREHIQNLPDVRPRKK
jgi:hypothetical protein